MEGSCSENGLKFVVAHGRGAIHTAIEQILGSGTLPDQTNILQIQPMGPEPVAHIKLIAQEPGANPLPLEVKRLFHTGFSAADQHRARTLQQLSHIDQISALTAKIQSIG